MSFASVTVFAVGGVRNFDAQSFAAATRGIEQSLEAVAAASSARLERSDGPEGFGWVFEFDSTEPSDVADILTRPGSDSQLSSRLAFVAALESAGAARGVTFEAAIDVDPLPFSTFCGAPCPATLALPLRDAGDGKPPAFDLDASPRTKNFYPLAFFLLSRGLSIADVEEELAALDARVVFALSGAARAGAPRAANPIPAELAALFAPAVAKPLNAAHNEAALAPHATRNAVTAAPNVAHNAVIDAPHAAYNALAAAPNVANDAVIAAPHVPYNALVAAPNLAHDALAAAPNLAHDALVAAPSPHQPPAATSGEGFWQPAERGGDLFALNVASAQENSMAGRARAPAPKAAVPKTLPSGLPNLDPFVPVIHVAPPLGQDASGSACDVPAIPASAPRPASGPTAEDYFGGPPPGRARPPASPAKAQAQRAPVSPAKAQAQRAAAPAASAGLPPLPQNPETLTVPQLRDLLRAYGQAPRSADRKPKLVDDVMALLAQR